MTKSFPTSHLLSQNANVDHKSSAGPQVLGEGIVGDSPDAKGGVKRLEPRLKDLVVAELLADDTDTWPRVVIRERIVDGAQTARIDAGLHKGRHEGVVVDAVTGDHGVEATDLATARQTRRHLVRLPVQRREADAGSGHCVCVTAASTLPPRPPRGRGRAGRAKGGLEVLVNVALEQALDVGLVRQDVAGDARGEGEGAQRGDAAAELEDRGGGGGGGGRPDRVVGGCEP